MEKKTVRLFVACWQEVVRLKGCGEAKSRNEARSKHLLTHQGDNITRSTTHQCCCVIACFFLSCWGTNSVCVWESLCADLPSHKTNLDDTASAVIPILQAIWGQLVMPQVSWGLCGPLLSPWKHNTGTGLYFRTSDEASQHLIAVILLPDGWFWLWC